MSKENDDYMVEVLRLNLDEHREISEICERRGVTFQEMVMGLLMTKVCEDSIAREIKLKDRFETPDPLETPDPASDTVMPTPEVVLKRRNIKPLREYRLRANVQPIMTRKRQRRC